MLTLTAGGARSAAISTECVLFRDKLPSGFIITGPNAASEELLFDQLLRTLRRDGSAAFVQLHSAEAPNLKAALKKIILDSTSRSSTSVDDEGDEEVAVGQDVRACGRNMCLGAPAERCFRDANISIMIWRLCTSL
jgi:hypothetical protein